MTCRIFGVGKFHSAGLQLFWGKEENAVTLQFLRDDLLWVGAWFISD